MTWLKGTVGMVELSLQTLKYQQAALASLGEASKSVQAGASDAAPNFEALAKSGAAINPALWAWNMMQQPATVDSQQLEAKPKKKSSTRKPR
ncbi:MAG: hypothetical protein LH481_17045 [Burkholderiales bacterium]|nr:hypothetical protein [Burkholderiales bacterium]